MTKSIMDQKWLVTVMLMIFCVVIPDRSCSRLSIRHKRSVDENSPSSDEVVIISDHSSRRNRPRFSIIPVYTKSDADIFSLDLDEDDGSFRMNGRIPSFLSPVPHRNLMGTGTGPAYPHIHPHRPSMGPNGMPFVVTDLQGRFDEMMKRILLGLAASSRGNGHPFCCRGAGVGPTFDGSSEPGTEARNSENPDNYNKTNTEIVEFNGKKFLKKTQVIQKGGPTSQIFISTTSFEPYVGPTNEVEGSSADSNPDRETEKDKDSNDGASKVPEVKSEEDPDSGVTGAKAPEPIPDSPSLTPDSTPSPDVPSTPSPAASEVGTEVPSIEREPVTDATATATTTDGIEREDEATVPSV